MPFGAPLTILGLATAATGTFALPLNQYSDDARTQFGFVELHSVVSFYRDNGAPGNAFSELAQIWWIWGVFVAFAVLLALVLAIVAAPTTRWLGRVLAACAAAAGVLQVLALTQSVDLFTFGQSSGTGYSQSNTVNHAGVGVWVSIVGFALAAFSGLFVAFNERPAPPESRRPLPPAPDERPE